MNNISGIILTQLILILLLCSCKSKMKCTPPSCPSDGTISYSIDDQANQNSYQIDCDKDLICVCFCADIPDDLQGELWTANLLESGSPIQTITAEDVGANWEGQIPVDAEVYGVSKTNLTIEVFIGATGTNRIQSNQFSWSCQ